MKQAYILFVEDNANDVDLTLISFKEYNFNWPIVVVRDGAEALEYLFGEGRYAGRDVKLKPSLVLLDLNLPKISGHQVLARIRAERSLDNTPVVILSSSDEEKDRIVSAHLGASLYIRKPVDFDEFENVVKQIDLLFMSARSSALCSANVR